MNRVKDLLKGGGTAIGTTASVESEVRFLAGSQFDFLLFDTQHAPVEIKQLAQPLRAMRGRNAIPVVRVGDNRPDLICYALDLGAKGIVVPMVNTAAEAERMVSWCRYPPAGERSSAGERGEWGKHDNYRDYMDTVNEHLLLLPMIETMEAMDNIDAIAAVAGVDVLLVGPSDLSINLGVPLDYRNPKYLAALDTIGTACRNAGIAAGMYFVPPGIEPAALVEKGFRLFTLPWAGWATDGINAGLAAHR